MGRPGGLPYNKIVPLLEMRPEGLYCPVGDFYIDPWAPVERAVITHAHSDHACPGSRNYLTSRDGAALLRERIGPEGMIEAVPYGERAGMVSFHPAGHILGSAQVRIEHAGEVWVVSGDYKLAPDATCAPFEPVRCHTFVTESTFGLPIFRWRDERDVWSDVHQWWRGNIEAGKTSVLYAYPLGKAQRVLAGIDTTIGPIWVHPAVERYSRIYREHGVDLPAGSADDGSLIIAPPEFEHRGARVSTAMASGWMRIRGTRRRRSLDRGFVLSDHADWPELLRAIDATGAETVWVTHGHRAPLVRWLQEHGRQAVEVEAHFEEPEQ
jgi:putative mRNA 3-end processing factor